MTIRIDMNVSNYERVASRWNDVHFASRKHLASILTSDFNLESPMTQRRLKALETRARAFYANQLEKDLKAQEAYDKQLLKYEADMVAYEKKMEKFQASDAPKKQAPTKPVKPEFPKIPNLEELIDRPKNGNVELRYKHRMKLANVSQQKKKRVHFVTSGQIGADGWDSLWQSIKNWGAHRHGAIWVGSSTYGTLKIAEDGVIESSMDEMFYGHIVLDKNIHLNDNIVLNTMRLRPTLRNPIQGLSSTEGNATEVYFHPKNELQYIAQTSDKLPRAKLTSASCTIPDYSRNKLGQQDKTGELAQREHVFGGWVIEIVDDKIFHMRPIVADKNGCFYDIFYTKRGKLVCKKFTPNGVEDAQGHVSGIVTGDSHFATKPKIDLPWKIGTCPKVWEATYGKKGLINALQIPEVFMHDTFDGHSISHHNEKEALLLEHMFEAGLLCLRSELDNYHQSYASILNSTKAKFYDVASNHPEHLYRWLQEERYNNGKAYNNINKKLGMELFLQAANDPFFKPLEGYTRKHLSTEQNERLRFLQRDEDFYCEGIKVDMHGDLGANGSRGSDTQLHNLGIKCVVGHRHTPGIRGLVWTVGTSTHLKVQYTKGLSSWVNTHCLIFRGGQRMLINIIDGEFAWNPTKKPQPKLAA
ncbi:MAG: hypothetical protein VX154_03845 [Pseudomonadota bacterium]|nr:hypothetical protein [Pseudomonadota bacterium]